MNAMAFVTGLRCRAQKSPHSIARVYSTRHLGGETFGNDCHAQYERGFLSVSAFMSLLGALATIVVQGSNGSDGSLNLSTNTVIDLARAGLGAWDGKAPANRRNGLYDPEKWEALKYASGTLCRESNRG